MYYYRRYMTEYLPIKALLKPQSPKAGLEVLKLEHFYSGELIFPSPTKPKILGHL